MQKDKYIVFVDDNFNFMDTSEGYLANSYDTCEMAIEKCKQILDMFLESAYKKNMSVTELIDSWYLWGDDPYIIDENCNFSSSEYVQIKAKEIIARVAK